jgi:hypothetical protein
LAPSCDRTRHHHIHKRTQIALITQITQMLKVARQGHRADGSKVK